MDKEIKEMLESILAQQVVLYKKLDNIERRMKGSTLSSSLENYLRELQFEADKIKNQL